MKTRKLLSIACVTFFMISCFIFQTSVFATDDESANQIYLPETDEQMAIDDLTDVEAPADIQNDMDIDYETDQEQVEGDYQNNYPEDEMNMDEPEENEYNYDETDEEQLPLEK